MKKTLPFLFCLLGVCLFLPQNVQSTDWTFMVYLDADNNLESAGIDDFLEMASVGSDANVNIVVQFDRISGYDSSFGDWSNCQRFLVTNHMDPRVRNAIADWGDGVGGREVNMDDPQTLIDFVEWAMDNYPAHNYALILWNHGGGWREDVESKKPVFKAVCWDDTSGFNEALEMSEVAYALETIENSREQVNLVGFDACLMGMIEVAYEIKDLASVMVVSQETEPGDGWPYNTLLSDLVTSPTMSSTDLGTIIVNRYGESYGIGSDTTQASIDLNMVDALATAVNDFAVAMDSNKSEIADARANSQEYSYPEHIDLYHFSELLYAASSDPDVQTTANDVMAAVESSVIAEFHGNGLPDSHGLAIYFPKKEGSFDSDYNGSIIDFPADTEWDEFLHWYYGSGGDEIVLLSPVDGAVLPAKPPATFTWEADPGYRFKIEFSPTLSFPHAFPTISLPKLRWIPDTSTDTIPVWDKIWNTIKKMEQRHGIVYWRVIGKGPIKSVDISEVRSFTIE